MKRHLAIAAASLALVAPSLAEAAQHVYPERGQSVSKQRKDESACSSWATSKTGFDPATNPPPVTASAQPVTGSGARAVGAGAGALVSGVAGGNPWTGALVGGLGGGLVKRVKNKNEADRVNTANHSYYQAELDDWNDARAACLTGRGYSVR